MALALGSCLSAPSLSYAAERKVRYELPLSNPYNDQILALSGAKYLYPQQACLDEAGGHLFVVSASRGGGDRSQWVAVYGWSTGDFLTVFKAGDGLGETCVVSPGRNGRPSIWIKSRGNNLLNFDVSSLPQPLSAPTYIEKKKAAVFYQSAMKNGRWFTETKTPGRDILSVLDHKFSEQTSVALTDANTRGSPHIKRQAIAVSDHGIVGSYGSNFILGRAQDPTMYGVKIFTFQGKIAYDGLDSPEKVMSQLNSQGVQTSRLENEGVIVTQSNEIYTIAITQAANTPAAKSGGLTIVRELSAP
jgi:hypothetical protein